MNSCIPALVSLPLAQMHFITTFSYSPRTPRMRQITGILSLADQPVPLNLIAGAATVADLLAVARKQVRAPRPEAAFPCLSELLGRSGVSAARAGLLHPQTHIPKPLACVILRGMAYCLPACMLATLHGHPRPHAHDACLLPVPHAAPLMGSHVHDRACHAWSQAVAGQPELYARLVVPHLSVAWESHASRKLAEGHASRKLAASDAAVVWPAGGVLLQSPLSIVGDPLAPLVLDAQGGRLFDLSPNASLTLR